jgi:SAM-dependent methyltransferase
MRRIKNDNPNTPTYWGETAIQDGFLTNFSVEKPGLKKLLQRDCVGSVLDVGAGSGMLTKYLPGQVTACDYSPAAVEHLNGWWPTFWCDLNEGIDLPDGSFDTVVCSEVLEHLDDYEAAVDELKRLAADRVIITVPNDKYSEDSREHVWAFTEKDIQALGFETTLTESESTIYGIHHRR